MKHIQQILLASLVLFLGGRAAVATPMLSIDLDPGTSGIQNSLTVNPGDTFDLSVVYTGDGIAQFDTTVFGVFFNNNGPVISTGSTDIFADDLAGTSSPSSSVLDVFSLSFTLVSSGDELTQESVTTLPTGFTAGTGLVGLLSLSNPFTVIASGVNIDVVNLSLTASSLGTSAITLFNDSGPELALFGEAVSATIAPATLRVVSPTQVPEPSTVLLLTSGLLLAAISRGRGALKKAALVNV